MLSFSSGRATLLSANFPYRVKFADRFKAHLSEEELEALRVRRSIRNPDPGWLTPLPRTDPRRASQQDPGWRSGGRTPRRKHGCV